MWFGGEAKKTPRAERVNSKQRKSGETPVLQPIQERACEILSRVGANGSGIDSRSGFSRGARRGDVRESNIRSGYLLE